MVNECLAVLQLLQDSDLKAVQKQFDKYVKVYGTKKIIKTRPEDKIQKLIDEDNAENFEKKWTTLITDIDAPRPDPFVYSYSNAYRFYGKRRMHYRFN